MSAVLLMLPLVLHWNEIIKHEESIMAGAENGYPRGEEATFSNPLEPGEPQDVEVSAEQVEHKPVTTIDVRRHSEYDGDFPAEGWGKATEEEQARLGHLTEAGVANAHRVAQEIIAKRMDEAGEEVDFLVIGSPTHWIGDEQLGQRAIETAKIYSDEVKRELEERGLPADRLLNTSHRQSRQHEVGDVRVGKNLVSQSKNG